LDRFLRRFRQPLTPGVGQQPGIAPILLGDFLDDDVNVLRTLAEVADQASLKSATTAAFCARVATRVICRWTTGMAGQARGWAAS
jgi:hypothetical protein